MDETTFRDLESFVTRAQEILEGLIVSNLLKFHVQHQCHLQAVCFAPVSVQGCESS